MWLSLSPLECNCGVVKQPVSAGVSLDTPLLIMGAGPVSLSLWLSLARFCVDCTVVERNISTTTHPQMGITNGRSREIFPLLGPHYSVLQFAPDKLAAKGFELEAARGGYRSSPYVPTDYGLCLCQVPVSTLSCPRMAG